MKVISTNIGNPTTIVWQGKEQQTGIYKYPVEGSILLESTDVKGDHVIDRKYHGGELKACYIYSADHYAFWKEKYPNLDWTYGMFGENLTIEGLDEKDILIGDIYQLGEAKVQVTQPRQPCFKLGIRFNDQSVIKAFCDTTFSGVYLAVLENGTVKPGDKMELIEKAENSVSIADVFSLMFHSPIDTELAKKALENNILPTNCKDSIRNKFMRQLA